ncbi:hypothetical protein A2U01_0060849, partial [Trifolium medium]|nr:hypothetical protein [Trifolium medium]
MEGRRPRKDLEDKQVEKNNNTSPNQVQEGAVIEEGVRVGEVLLRLGARKKVDGTGDGPSQRMRDITATVPQHPEKDTLPDTRVYVRKYKPTEEDVQWAHKGVVATVI